MDNTKMYVGKYLYGYLQDALMAYSHLDFSAGPLSVAVPTTVVESEMTGV